MPDDLPTTRRLGYPATRTVDASDTLHGVEVRDPYRWLEDGKAPEVQRWMGAEDALTREELAKLPERDAIAARLRELFYVDSVSAPHHRGARYFYARRLASKEKAIVYVREGRDGAEKVLFDPNTWSTDGSVALGTWSPSWDGNTVAFAIHKNNSDDATLYVLDVASGARSTIDVIEGARYADPSWTPKGDGFYYTGLPTDPSIDPADLPGRAEIRFHALGTSPSHDRVVHEKTGDSSVFLSAGLSRDGRWLVLSVFHGWTATDVYFRDLHHPGHDGPRDPWTPLAVGVNAHFSVVPHGDRLYVRTDEGAPRYRLFRVNPTKPARAGWEEIVPEREGATLDDFSVIGGRLALNYLDKATGRVEIRELDGTLVREVHLPGIGSVTGPYGRDDEDDAYFGYQSYTTPQEIYVTSMRTGETKLHSRVQVPIDASSLTVSQVFFPSKDGTRLSMFIVHRNDLKRDGHARTLLYGYGGFQLNETPAFTASIYPWLERGGIYAVANLRGGGEYGEDWHKAGMKLQKQNVFDDVVAAGEYLVHEGYMRADRLVISGGSNGGLLVGAAITQRPDLFAAALCAVPLLDMVRYHLFGAGKTWISEYGSADDAAELKALYAYSPYHHVKKGTRYPAVLFLSADSDDRVDPLHARKLAAALQAATTGGPVLLRIERNAGHRGADLLKSKVEEGADKLAFALAHTAGTP